MMNKNKVDFNMSNGVHRLFESDILGILGQMYPTTRINAYLHIVCLL